MQVAMIPVERIQAVLNFQGWESPQFRSSAGIGRIGVAGFGLGVIVGIHIGVVAANPWLWASWPVAQWALYVVCLAGFHFTEFFTTAMFKPTAVSYDSFVINHSTHYTMAVLASAVEFWVEFMFLGRSKFQWIVFGLGVTLVSLGQYFRSAAMWTARENFDHLIVEHRSPEHRLVTHGVYQFLRHPSYFGWFWWCMGTQLLLCNPIGTVLYAGAAWNFFQVRIPYEEGTLLRIFGDEYMVYAKKTPVRIPFVRPGIQFQGGGSQSDPPPSSPPPSSSPLASEVQAPNSSANGRSPGSGASGDAAKKMD